MCPFGGLPSAISTSTCQAKGRGNGSDPCFRTGVRFFFACLICFRPPALFLDTCSVCISNYILARQLHNCTLQLGNLKVSVLGTSARAKVLPVKKELRSIWIQDAKLPQFFFVFICEGHCVVNRTANAFGMELAIQSVNQLAQATEVTVKRLIWPCLQALMWRWIPRR